MRIPSSKPPATTPWKRDEATHTPNSASTSTGLGPLPKRGVDPSMRSEEKVWNNLSRYQLRKLLGRGGMGEVHLARDEHIGRSVALKILLDEASVHPDAHWRFLREARVQGQLEHPAVVPVYDLGFREGRAFFAMKRIAGVTLSEVIQELRKGNEEYAQKYSLRRILAVFQQICLALDYAHARGVVHRDIKPGNLMLGDFGEVYVLDWGIAKVGAEDEQGPASGQIELAQDDADSTRRGDVLGTAGYMAPEQMTSASTVDGRADVYSLGSVLFYLLALEPLHSAKPIADRLRSTLAGVDARPSFRAPSRNLPPELDSVCETAVAVDPAKRYASAREMHDAIGRFLDGDRDAQMRAELAERHIENARVAASMATSGAADADEQRTIALREAGRAIALDPKNPAAAGVLARLLLEPPKEIPPEVRARTEAVDRAELRQALRLGRVAFAALALLALLLPLSDLRDGWGLFAIVAPLVFAAGYCHLASKKESPSIAGLAVFLAIPVCVAIAATSSFAGPMFLTPVFALAFGSAVSMIHALGRYRVALLALTCATFVVPMILEWIGWIPPFYRFEHGVIEVLPHTVNLHETDARVALLGANLAICVVIAMVLARYSAAAARRRAQFEMHAWHLEQLAPTDVRREAPRSDAPPVGVAMSAMSPAPESRAPATPPSVPPPATIAEPYPDDDRTKVSAPRA